MLHLLPFIGNNSALAIVQPLPAGIDLMM